MGIEALSRGAAHAWFLERSRPALELIRENISALGVEGRVHRRSPARCCSRCPRQSADIVFLDPPYDQEREYAAALEALAANPPALVIVQHSIRRQLPESAGRLHLTRTVRQGDNILSFFAPAPTT